MAILIVFQVILLFVKFEPLAITCIWFEFCYILQNKQIEEKDRKIDLLEREKINNK
jgi:hypothetical protein